MRGVAEQPFWRHIFEHWDDQTSVDLHETFGIDTYGADFWSRPWPWAYHRLRGLMTTDTRVRRALTE